MFSPSRAGSSGCGSERLPEGDEQRDGDRPQVMPNKVSSVRTFCWRTSCSICLRNESEVTRSSWAWRALTTTSFPQSLPHLHVDAVGEPEPDSPSCRLLGLSARHPTVPCRRRRPPGARQEQHVLLLAHHDVGVGRVARAQHDGRARLELDLDVEEGRALGRLGLGRDLVHEAFHGRLRQRPHLDARGHALVQLAHVDLVNRALEDQRRHVGQGGERGARLVGGEGDHGVPSLTSSSSTVPAMGARMMDSTFALCVRPFWRRASLSVARFRRMRASSTSLSAVSESWLDTMPCRRSASERSCFFFAWS